MKAFLNEVLQRFPEVADQVNDGDEDLPHVVVGYIVEWLLSVELDSATTERVTAFDRWCMQQPRGQTAADDILTIETVAFSGEVVRIRQTSAARTQVDVARGIAGEQRVFQQVGWRGSLRSGVAACLRQRLTF